MTDRRTFEEAYPRPANADDLDGSRFVDWPWYPGSADSTEDGWEAVEARMAEKRRGASTNP